MTTLQTPKFRMGDTVLVKNVEHKGHHRTPWYIKGKAGKVSAISGTFPNPEIRAYGDYSPPRVPLYLVEFGQSDIWPDYEGLSTDKIYLDIFEHWLEPI